MATIAGETRAANSTKEALYEELLSQVGAVLCGEDDPLVWMTTLCCLIRQQMNFFWVGFYIAQGRELRIGPYQGTLGCLRIPFGRGVCGTAARERRTIIVPDVNAFPGHIACDSRSQSEIVVPVFDDHQNLRAVLDIDSDRLRTFNEVDQTYLEMVVGRMKTLAWTAPS